MSAWLICGVDEAGRGPLAGPVYAAAVILNDRQPIVGLADSKKLTAKKRDALTVEIKQHAMQRAIAALHVRPQEVWVDGLHYPNTGLPSRAITQGDNSVAAISAASILAKTARDAAMMSLHEQYPQYNFAAHKGYPTAAHVAALALHGVSPHHRRSFRPVREVLHKGTSD